MNERWMMLRIHAARARALCRDEEMSAARARAPPARQRSSARASARSNRPDRRIKTGVKRQRHPPSDTHVTNIKTNQQRAAPACALRPNQR